MKKKLLIFLVVIVIAIAGVIFYAAYNADAILAKLKSELESMASKSLGSTLTIGKMDFSAFPVATVKLDKVSLTDSKDKKLTLDRGELRVSLVSLLQGRLDIKSLEIVKPEVNINQTKEGIKIDGIKAKGGAKKAKGEVNAAQPASASTKTAANNKLPLPSWLGIDIKKVSISGGNIIFTPLAKEGKEPAKITLIAFNFKSGLEIVSDKIIVSSLNSDGSVVEKKAKFALKLANANYDLTSQSFDTQNLNLEVTSENKSIGEINALVPAFSGNLKNSEIKFTNVVVNALAGDSNLSGSYNYKTHSGDIKFDVKGVKFKGESIAATGNVVAKDGNFQVNGMTAEAFGGGYLINAGGEPLTNNIPFNLKLDLTKQLSIDRALSAVSGKNPAAFRGDLTALVVNASGAASPNLMSSLKANINLKLENGEFKGGNLPAMVLKAVKDVPLLSDRLFGSVPDKHKSELDGDTTPIKVMTSQVDISGSTAMVNALRMESNLFSMDAKGTVGLNNQELNLDTTFRFMPALSLALLSKIKELKGLMDSEDRLVIPLTIKGTPTKPIIIPDMKELMKLGAGEALKEGARKLLDKALGGNSGSDGQGSKEKDIVDGVGKLFGF